MQKETFSSLGEGRGALTFLLLAMPEFVSGEIGMQIKSLELLHEKRFTKIPCILNDLYQ